MIQQYIVHVWRLDVQVDEYIAEPQQQYAYPDEAAAAAAYAQAQAAAAQQAAAAVAAQVQIDNQVRPGSWKLTF